MAQQVITRLIDDLTGGDADETVKFSLDGHEFEIDLSRDNAGELRDGLAQYMAKARKAGKGTSAPVARRGVANGQRPAGDRQRTAEIREWATRCGIAVSDRGRLSREVLRAYEDSRGQLASAG